MSAREGEKVNKREEKQREKDSARYVSNIPKQVLRGHEIGFHPSG